MFPQLFPRTLLVIAVFAFAAAMARADSEIVIAIRYLQAMGTSHSHLYLYREDGKLLRQLTNDNSGQDLDPIFSADGETIVFTREKPNNVREFWSVEPRSAKLKQLGAAPDWYLAAKDSPCFRNPVAPEEKSATASPAPSAQESASASDPNQSTDSSAMQPSATPLEAAPSAEDGPPQTIKAPDGSGEIFWRKGNETQGPGEPQNWVMWFRDSKSGQETKIGNLPGFPSYEPLQIRGNKDGQFLFEGPLRLTFFSCHLNSTDGTTVEAFDFNNRKLIRLSPNYATPIPLPGEAAFLTFTENRYVPIPGSQKTANCSYMERWDANIKETYYGNVEPPYSGGVPEARYARKGSAAICYGASMYRPAKQPAVITFRSGEDE